MSNFTPSNSHAVHVDEEFGITEAVATLDNGDFGSRTIRFETGQLARQADGRWLGIHSHMSLRRGVPQDSHGNRPVKAR